MATNPWEMDWSQPQSGPVYGAPDPDAVYKARNDVRADQDQQMQAARFGLDTQKLQSDLARDQRQISKEEQEQADKIAKADRAKSDSIFKIADVLDKIDQVDTQARNGWADTGRPGAFVRSLPDFVSAGSDAYNLAANLKKIDAASAFSTLQNMRENSPTGGALGAVSDTELGLLKSSVSNLDPNQSEAQFLGNLNEARNSYLNILRRLDPEAAAEYERRRQNPSQSNEQETGLNVTVTDTSPNGDGSGGAPSGGDQYGRAARESLGDVNSLWDTTTGLGAQGITLGLSDEAKGVGAYISALLQGDNPATAYRSARDASREWLDQARQNNPILGTGAELIGGGAAARIANAPTTLRGAGTIGSALGGLTGYGYGEGASGSVGNALGGAAVGGALGVGGQAAGNALGRYFAGRTSAPTADQVAVIQAGERQNIPIRQAEVRPELRNRLADLETTQRGGPAVNRAFADDTAAIEGRIGEIGGAGNASDPYALGSQVQDAGRRYIANTRAQAGRLYDRARDASQGSVVQPTEAIASLDANIADLRATGENANAAAIKYLEDVRSDLSGGNLTVDAVRNIRTNMRGQISERGLTGTDTERRISDAIAGANSDLMRDLPAEASQAYRAADDFYRQRQDFVNGTLKQFMGDRGNPLPAETASRRLISMAQGKGNYERFSKMFNQLEPSEKADVAATIAESLGRKTNGDFSISTLIKSLDPSKGINPRTAKLVFGEDGASALNDLRAISRAKVETRDALNNSRTGVAVNKATGGLKTLLASVLGLGAGGPGGAAAAAVAREFFGKLGEQRAARLLLNPDFTKWLRNAPNTSNPQAIDRYFNRLSNIGSVAANDNQAFSSALMNAFRQSPGRAAAQDEADGRREPVS